jgi:hypothetical protein
MANKNTSPSKRQTPQHEPDLDSRYGEIGISAVAAALQEKREAKNPAYAPVSPRLDDQLADATS